MPADLATILKIDVPIIVRISLHEMTMREILGMAPGSIVELPVDADEELEVLVGDKPIAMGRAVKVGENFGIRIGHVGNVRERIGALGSASIPEGGEEDIDPEAFADRLLAGLG